MEQANGRWNRQERGNVLGPGRLAPDRYPTGIAAKGGNGLLNPEERRDDVAQGVVAAAAEILAEDAPGFEETEQAEPMADGNTGDAGSGEGSAIIDRPAGAADDLAAAMQPDEHRVRPSSSRRPDVEIKAVLACRRRRHGVRVSWIEARIGRLRGCRREGQRVARPGPRRERLRRPETQRADWCGGKRNAPEAQDLARAHTAQPPKGHVDGDALIGHRVPGRIMQHQAWSQ